MFLEFFKRLEADDNNSKLELFRELVEIIRSKQSEYEDVDSPIENLSYFFKYNPDCAKIFLESLINFISEHKQVYVFSHTGLLSGRNFYTLLRERIGEYFLPPVADEKQFSHILTLIFNSEEDVAWLASITDKQWFELFEVISVTASGLNANVLSKLRKLQENILQAINLVSYDVSGLSLDEELIKAYPEILELNSPFTAQNQEIQDYIKSYNSYLLLKPSDNSITPPDEDHILVMVDQCKDLIKKIHNNTHKSGISIRLTNILVRLEQKLNRLEKLLFLLHPDAEIKSAALGKLVYTITYHHHNSSSIRSLVRSNTELLSLKITENASEVGEAYVSKDLKGYWKMFRISAGAGILIGLMATLKILLGKFIFPPIVKAFFNSMNYSFGFMLIHVFHFKIATKQPAMTASALAASIEESENKRVKLTELSQLIVDILRTQFAAILGNITLAMPVAFACCYAWTHYLNETMITDDKAQYLLDGIDPLNSMSLFYAAITGVCLFFSGIISGYYNNLAIYRNLGERITNQPFFNKVLGNKIPEKIGHYIQKNLGPLAGNFWFGVMLGSMPTIGYIFGLPLDIRHIAFSSANFIQGFYWLDTNTIDYFYVFYIFVGVLLIGLVNLFVSFSLALIVALRARKVRFAQWKELFDLVLVHIATNPGELFWPKKQAKQNKN